MRITLLFLVLALSACSTAQPVTQASYAPPNIKVAEAACRKKGYDQTSFEYSVCYGNRPEVQAYTRNQRISDLAIINKNRSGGKAGGRSYPVE